MFKNHHDTSPKTILRIRGGGCFDWLDQIRHKSPPDESGHTPMLGGDPKSKSKDKSKDKDKTKSKSKEGDIKIKHKGKKYKLKNKKDGTSQIVPKNDVAPATGASGPGAGLGLGLGGMKPDAHDPTRDAPREQGMSGCGGGNDHSWGGDGVSEPDAGGMGIGPGGMGGR